MSSPPLGNQERPPALRRPAVTIAAGVLLVGGVVTMAILLTNADSSTANDHMASATRQRRSARADEGGAIPIFPAVSDAPDDEPAWRRRWRSLSAAPASTEREAALVAFIGQLAATDPADALALAREETTPALRDALLSAAFRGWAATDREAAAIEALLSPETEHVLAAAAVLDVAAQQPDDALRLARRFCAEDPAYAHEHGGSLISALARVKQYEAAVQFALTTETPGESESRNQWLQSAFRRWAEREPEAAVVASLRLPEEGMRFEALQAVVAGWVQLDPEGTTEFIRQLPIGADRTNTLGEALRLWVKASPKAASEWLDRLEPNPELDAGVAALATLPQLVAHRPEVAISWAESIVDAERRSNALTAIVRQWAETDAGAARRYAEQSADLLPADRATLLRAP